MIEENEGMMGLMTELYEKNAIQTRLISSLPERVQKLEKAFASVKLRKKKRNATATDGSDKFSETKKCD
ncbi:hypothetical protein K1719_002891 [Acacia pycnantha]|nr:hypothetical protein K1719_002891 [Acacia pycnantha]